MADAETEVRPPSKRPRFEGAARSREARASVVDPIQSDDGRVDAVVIRAAIVALLSGAWAAIAQSAKLSAALITLGIAAISAAVSVFDSRVVRRRRRTR